MAEIAFRLTFITAAEAAKMLEKNVDNRKPRQKVVEAYCRDMLANSWELTHQALAVDMRGHLIDGQHRLMAQVASGVDLWWYVAHYPENRGPKGLMVDRNAPRNAVDILECDRKDQEVARVIIRCATGINGATVSEVGNALNTIPEIQLVRDRVRSAGRGNRASRGVRAGFVLAMRENPSDTDLLLEQLNKFVSLDIDGLWPSLVSLARTFELGGVQDATWYMARTYHAICPQNRIKSGRLVKESEVKLHMKEMCKNMIGGEK